MKRLIMGISLILLILSVSCSGTPEYTTYTTTTTTTNPPETQTNDVGNGVETFTKEWAESCVLSYLNSLAESPEAIRYLADLYSQGWFESIYSESEIDQEYAGHKYSGWQVYYRPTGTPSRENWNNLNWAVFKDGFVSEGSTDALRVKADLLELNSPEYNENTPQEPTETTTPPVETTTPAVSFDMTPSQIVGSHLYDGQQVEVSGQVFHSESGHRLVVDGKTGINLTGNVAELSDGIYTFRGYYDTDTNTLDVSRAVEENVFPELVDIGKILERDLVPVEVSGLAATPPKEISNTITNYLSIPYLPKNLPVYPYVVFTEEGLYLAISDTEIELPTKFSFYSEGKDCSFTFSAGEVTGVLLKTPSDSVDLGTEWIPEEFRGIIIADTITPFDPVVATVRNINANPDHFIFKRVSIQGSYLVTTATIDYSDMQAPIGQGILADDFSDFFDDDTDATIETIDPEAITWQLRRCWVTATVLYPTEEILKYLDYSQPLSPTEIAAARKPALIVDTLLDDWAGVVSISQLNPVTGNPSLYWGKVVEFEGYALGIKYPIKNIAEAVSSFKVPVNVNLVMIGIADNPSIGSQLFIIGLDNELTGKHGEAISANIDFGWL